MSPEVWIPITLAAAFFQNIRSYLQKRLVDVSTVHGGAYVRFLYALPFAWLYVFAIADDPFVMSPNATFWMYCAVGAISQIVGTAFLLASFAGGQFAVGTVLSKTEAAQALLFGMLLLGDAVSSAAIAGIAISFLGVLLISGRMSLEQLNGRTLGLGLGAGSAFGVAAVGFRGAALSLPVDSALQAAAITLAVAVSIQTLLYGAYLGIREPSSLRVAVEQWRIGLRVGMSGMAASACWFTAMALVSAALVRALGQVELLFTLATSAWLLGERIGRREVLGVALVVGGLVLITITPTG